jgi:hypothetical protein
MTHRVIASGVPIPRPEGHQAEMFENIEYFHIFGTLGRRLAELTRSVMRRAPGPRGKTDRLPQHEAPYLAAGVFFGSRSGASASSARALVRARREAAAGADLVPFDGLRPRDVWLSSRCRRNSIALRDVVQRLVANVVAEVRQRSRNPVIAPGRILFNHAEHELLHLLVGTRTSTISALGRAVELLRRERTGNLGFGVI